MTLTFDPIDPKIESNGPRIITNHPTKFHAIRFNTFWVMRITHTHTHTNPQKNTQRSKHNLPQNAKVIKQQCIPCPFIQDSEAEQQCNSPAFKKLCKKIHLERTLTGKVVSCVHDNSSTIVAAQSPVFNSYYFACLLQLGDLFGTSMVNEGQWSVNQGQLWASVDWMFDADRQSLR